MKTWKRRLIGISSVGLVSVGILALSCKVNSSKNSPNTIFADTAHTAVTIPSDSMEVTKALQATFRSISSQVLPAVVEVDVVEKTKVQVYNPFKDIPFFNFQDGGDDEYREREQSGLGSGVIVRRTGKTIYVLTNNHVAGKATTIKIKLNDEREFDGKLVGADERMDIALVSFECSDDNITVAKLGDSDEVQQGDIVLALGSPLGYFASVTQGIVSATGRSGGQIGSISDFIQTDAAINQGNSGGPLVNIYGEIIGINTWIASQSGGSQGLGFSIPINNIKKAIDQFINVGRITYGWLGVSLDEIEQEYKDALGIGKANGVFITEVFKDGPAMNSGIQAGDYIISVNGKDVKTIEQVQREVGSIRAGETAKFVVLRGKTKVEINVKIEERKDEISSDNSKLWPGFTALPVTDKIRKELKLPSKINGVVVARIIAKSPASALRLQNGDIITAVNGTKISNVQEFYAAIDTTRIENIQFEIYSSGSSITTGTYSLKQK